MKIEKKDLDFILDFQRDKELYYLLNFIASEKDSMLYSDMESYVIGQTESPYPIWIWSKPSLSDSKLKELEKDLSLYLVDGNNKITCTRELYDSLSKDYQVCDYFEMGFLTCEKTIKPSSKGIFVRVNYSDKLVLANYWIANEKEMSKKDVSLTEALEQVEKWIDSKRFYVLKDAKGNIVSMAGYSVVDSMANISYVYTPVSERGKGYCQCLIYELTKLLLREGLKPLLYTDYHYPASNRAYQKVGYVDSDFLINFQIIQ